MSFAIHTVAVWSTVGVLMSSTIEQMFESCYPRTCRGKGWAMGASDRLKASNDVRTQRAAVTAASKHGPLQSLSDRELALREHPVTVYPHALQRRVRAWVRFGAEAVRVDAKLMRSTPLAAGIEFRAEEQTFRCWVWGNAVEVQESP